MSSMRTDPSLLIPEDFLEPELLADLTNHPCLNTSLRGHSQEQMFLDLQRGYGKSSMC